MEPSVAGRERAAREYGLQLRADLAEYAAEQYDLITLVHSLEHADQPLTVLRALAGRLKPYGTLFVEVPHADSVELWRPARRRWILDLPVHLFHFTPESLGRLVAAAGLKVRRTELFNCDAVEWVIRQRVRIMRRTVDEADSPKMGSGVRACEDRGGGGWASRVALPHLRRLAPGWKFQIYAGRG
jgi:SAM-dependent methyltransferase